MGIAFGPVFELDELMQVVLLALGMFSCAGAATVFARQAPEGYEDDNGFHFS